MSQAISGVGGPVLPPTLSAFEMHRGKDARSAPVSPERQVPIIDKSKVDPELRRSAEGMETMFLDYLLKVMRETIPKNEMDLESPATSIYRSMLDSQFAEKAAHHGGIGLADQIIAYLHSRGYNEGQGQGVPSKEKP